MTAKVSADESLRALGLDGVLPASASPTATDVANAELIEGPSEAWAYRAGVKPVVFLTVPEDRVAWARSFFPGAHVEEHARRVQIEARDRWVDRRDQGEPRIELYISADASLACEAAALQTGANPSRATLRLGELMGYPPCCAQAFHRQDDRSNNTRNRYATAARTHGHPWYPELNNLLLMLVPFFPCSYRCDAARTFATRTLGALRQEHADAANRVAELQRRPALYFAHGEVIVFDGTAPAANVVEYIHVSVSREAPERVGRLATALRQGDRFTLDAGALRVTRSGAPVFDLRRSEPATGFVAPFGGLEPVTSRTP